MDMVQGDEQTVMIMETTDAPSLLSRARSPSCMRASSLEMETKEETEEKICSVELMDEENMDEGYNTSRLEMIQHLSRIQIDTGSSNSESYTTAIDNRHIPSSYPHPPPHTLPTLPTYPYQYYLYLTTLSRLQYEFPKSRKEEGWLGQRKYQEF